MKLQPVVALGLLCVLVGTPQALADGIDPDRVDSLVKPYLTIQGGLAGDDLATAKSGAAGLVKAMSDAGRGAEAMAELEDSVQTITGAADIAAARGGFRLLSRQIQRLVTEAGTSGETPLFVAHCPMAFGGEGASWLQADKTIANPYYGAAMLRCGRVQGRLPVEDHEHHGESHGHAGHQH